MSGSWRSVRSPSETVACTSVKFQPTPRSSYPSTSPWKCSKRGSTGPVKCTSRTAPPSNLLVTSLHMRTTSVWSPGTGTLMNWTTTLPGVASVWR
ncbi:hypothetical protein Hamer_G019087 [Homarus americanus]|uniref:Uncharacterized protein n=1 Tax=Homarus americanus TaxID=6706 RepID=A0A8J5MTV9_HOMAM|nr:hypothetical protein Hamer_G019087 [Homarus americanus]